MTDAEFYSWLRDAPHGEEATYHSGRDLTLCPVRELVLLAAGYRQQKRDPGRGMFPTTAWVQEFPMQVAPVQRRMSDGHYDYIVQRVRP